MKSEPFKQKLTNLVKGEERIADVSQMETGSDLKRAKEILTHQLPGAGDEEVIAYALRFLLEKIDPLRKPAAESKSGLKRAIHQSARGQCTYVDPQTGERCLSRCHQLPVSPAPSKAHGGGEEKERKLLCRRHSPFEAERFLGRQVIAPYWKKH